MKNNVLTENRIMLASKTILPRVARCAALPAAVRSRPFTTTGIVSHKESSSSKPAPPLSLYPNHSITVCREKERERKKKDD